MTVDLDITAPEVDAQIDTLEARGLIRVAAYQPELEYLFRHWLVQDAAYGSLLKQERRELHRQVGEALESLYPDRHAELSGILAMHFEQAGDTDKAVAYLVAAGRHAQERNAIRESYAAFDRASELLAPGVRDGSDGDVRRWIDIQLARARAGWTFRPAAELQADLEELLPAVEDTGDMELIAQAHLQMALVLFEHGTPATDAVLSRSLDRLAEISSALQDPGLAALPLALMAMSKVFRGPIREGVEALEGAIPLMQKHRDFIGAAFARGWLAIGYAGLGEFEKAEAASREATEMATNGDVIAQIDAQISQAMVRSMHGDLDEAAPLAQACVSLSQDSGATYCAVVSAWILGDVYQRQGRFNEAGEALRLGLEIAPGADPGMWGPTLQAWLRANAEALGDHVAADEGWEASLATAQGIGNHLGVAALHWKRAEVAVGQERWDAALEDMAASAAILEEQGARPNLARVLRGWGETLRSAGRQADGDDRLRRSLRLFEEMGLEREAREVRDELGNTASPEA